MLRTETIARFLGARDLQALSQTCARNRAEISSHEAWRANLRAQFPHKIAQPAFIAREPEYNAREFLLLLEDRAIRAHAVTHSARLFLAPEEVEASRERAISAVSHDGIIKEIIYVPQNSLMLRGDIIHVVRHGEYFYMFDGVYARDMQANASHWGNIEITLPITIKIGVEFGIEYFKELVDSFDRASFYIDPNLANYTRAVMIHRDAGDHCELEYSGTRYTLHVPRAFLDINDLMQYAKHTSIRIVTKQESAYGLQFN
jgi:hypothetical protein